MKKPVKRKRKPKKFKCQYRDVCSRETPHNHCNECGSTKHGAAYCDAENDF